MNTTNRRVTSNDVCAAIRAFSKRCFSHDDMIDIINCISSALKKPSALNAGCVEFSVDMMDEAIGQIERDQIGQADEAA